MVGVYTIADMACVVDMCTNRNVYPNKHRKRYLMNSARPRMSCRADRAITVTVVAAKPQPTLVIFAPIDF